MSAQLKEVMKPKGSASGSVRSRVSDAEWQVRVDLAACYRLVAHYRMTDLIYTHISARVPGPEHHFLINAYGLMFDEITASALVKVDLDGNILEDETGLGINEAGYVIHSAVHRAREDVQCVIHTHTGAGIAVSAQAGGLLNISQHSMRFHNRMAYHDYEGIALDLDEQSRLQANLGNKFAMILRNHGLLACGTSVADAWDNIYYMERSCQAQIAAQSGGGPLTICSDAVAERVATQFQRPGRPSAGKQWVSSLRLLDKLDPSYKE